MKKKSEAACRSAYEAVLPRIQLHAEIGFRNVRCPCQREELIAEAIGLSWQWWRRLWEKGKDPRRFVSAIAGYAVKAARSGRRVCGHERTKDVMSPVAQRLHGFCVGKLPDFETLLGNPLIEALHDNTVTPPDEQVAFRLDFPVWLASWDERRRRLIEQMAHGHRTCDLADRFGMSPGRISQLRREFLLSWMLFVE